MKRWILVALVLAAVMVPGKSFALLGLVSVEGAVGGFMPSPSGHLQYDGANNTNGDVEALLGFDEETFGTARLRVELPLVLPNVYLMATPMEFEGDLTGTFRFKNVSFSATDDAKLTLNQYDIGLFYGVPFMGLATLGNVGVDFGLNVRMLELEAELTQAGGGVTTESLDVPIPLLFLAAQVDLIGGFAVEAEARGLDVGYARVISLIGRVKYNTFGPFFFAAGYRHEEVEVDHDDIKMDITFSGPFAEAGFSF